MKMTFVSWAEWIQDAQLALLKERQWVPHASINATLFAKYNLQYFLISYCLSLMSLSIVSIILVDNKLL